MALIIFIAHLYVYVLLAFYRKRLIISFSFLLSLEWGAVIALYCSTGPCCNSGMKLDLWFQKKKKKKHCFFKRYIFVQATLTCALWWHLNIHNNTVCFQIGKVWSLLHTKLNVWKYCSSLAYDLNNRIIYSTWVLPNTQEVNILSGSTSRWRWAHMRSQWLNCYTEDNKDSLDTIFWAYILQDWSLQLAVENKLSQWIYYRINNDS